MELDSFHVSNLGGRELASLILAIPGVALRRQDRATVITGKKGSVYFYLGIRFEQVESIPCGTRGRWVVPKTDSRPEFKAKTLREVLRWLDR
jgi:hypothetical protein